MAALDDTELLAKITWAQTGATTREEYLDGLIALLSRLIPSDGVLWSRVDFASGRATLYGEPRELYRGIGTGTLMDALGDNPMMRSYWVDVMLRRHDRPPRRMSDVASPHELRATNTYAALLHPLRAESQLTVLTRQTGLLSGSSWIFSRDGEHDFSDEEVALAARVQPVLVLLQKTGVLDGPEDDRTDAAALVASVTALPEPTDDFDLTQRELQILSLLAHGLTAAAIGRYLRISDRTVRKHLENSYRKLHCNDRLVAVDRARAAGLLPRIPFPAPPAAGDRTGR